MRSCGKSCQRRPFCKVYVTSGKLFVKKLTKNRRSACVHLVKELEIENFEIISREEVTAKWGSLTDPWGNQLGFFEYLDKKEENDRIKTILGQVL